ncbi:helicase associated domain-containing protein [Streptomyces sp. NPDC002889]|uniref:helicase associated domain-containing protein n=1 Tax=Streptomyces sp. NPDC002889 TaxID=3364669 RepID=UPI0036B1F004
MSATARCLAAASAAPSCRCAAPWQSDHVGLSVVGEAREATSQLGGGCNYGHGGTGRLWRQRRERKPIDERPGQVSVPSGPYRTRTATAATTPSPPWTTSLGLAQTAELPAAARKPTVRNREGGLAAARAFHHREGHLNVPQRHIEVIDGDHVRLGQWVSNARRRKDRLPPDRLRVLDSLGMRW